MSATSRILVSFLLTVGSASAFSPVVVGLTQSAQTTTSQLKVAPPVETHESARGLFLFWFFGASGGAGLARSAFPRMYKQVRTIQSLKGQGPTRGGETLGISPLAGYPDDICIADVEEIVNNKLTVDEMVVNFPVEGNFLADSGYLTFDAFTRANPNANPLALRAVFDTFSTSTDVVSPIKAQTMLDEYKQNPTTLKQKLLLTKLQGYSAILTLLFLLGLADVVAAGHAYHGWFPDWPGAENFPAGLFDSETGIQTIPQYWLSD